MILFIAGLAGEIVITVAWLKGTAPNEGLMFLFATMMGLPVFLQKDEAAPPPPPPPLDPSPPTPAPRAPEDVGAHRDEDEEHRSRAWRGGV